MSHRYLAQHKIIFLPLSLHSRWALVDDYIWHNRQTENVSYSEHEHYKWSALIKNADYLTQYLCWDLHRSCHCECSHQKGQQQSLEQSF